MGTWIIFQSGSIGGVPGGPQALKIYKNQFFDIFFEFLDPKMGLRFGLQFHRIKKFKKNQKIVFLTFLRARGALGAPPIDPD